MDEAAQAELDAIQKKLGKYKGKYGKDIGIDELEWVMLRCYGIMFSIFLATRTNLSNLAVFKRPINVVVCS